MVLRPPDALCVNSSVVTGWLGDMGLGRWGVEGEAVVVRVASIIL